MSNLLKLAKRSQKNRDWKKAADYFEQYIEKDKKNCNDDVYISYSKCLRRLGDVNNAEEVLQERSNSHPKSERILRELNNLYTITSEKSKEISTAKSLVNLNPESADNYFILGRAYASSINFEEAKRNYITGLECKHKMTIEELIKKIQSSFAKNVGEVSSEYNFISGRNNYGSFIHSYRDKRYFTKISEYNLLAKREKKFYKELCEDFSILKKITPGYVDSVIIDNIIYLTIEMIDDDASNSNHLEYVLAASQKISSIPYKAMAKKYPNPNYSFQLKNKPNPVTIFFTQIHQKYYNEKMFSSLYELINQNNYPESVRRVIQRLESLIMEKNLYTFIKPADHYSLIHGDFNQTNSIIDKETKTIKVFDWETFKIGLKFIDIARYFSSGLIPYSEVKKDYLIHEKTGKSLSLIEKIFFLYILILLYILTIRENIVEKDIEQYIMPALCDMEDLVSQLLEDNHDFIMGLLAKNKLKIKQLEGNVSKLNKKIVKLENRHLDMQNSKSWKLTAPLRKIMQIVKKKD